MTHYVLLAFAAFLLCGTILLVQKPTTFIGVRAHSAHDVLTKPHLIYGTAWKKEATAGLVYQAVKTGFRYIDTACQPKHYNEPGVGDGWTAAAQELGLTRQDLWLQTKFTPIGGQDPERIPYDKDKPIDQQAEESLQVSLKNLKTDYLDSWVLHSSPGSFEDLMKVWRVMERAVDDQQVLSIGISNIYDFETFQSLYEEARHKPKVRKRIYWKSMFEMICTVSQFRNSIVADTRPCLSIFSFSSCKIDSLREPTLIRSFGAFVNSARSNTNPFGR